MSKEGFIVVFCLVTVLRTVAPNPRSQEYLTNEPNSPLYDPNGTQALLTIRNFGVDDNGRGMSICDWKYHPLPEKVVSLSTGWFDNNARCGQLIKIMANGRTAFATVVDECASDIECGLSIMCPPSCRTNVIEGSHSVWDDLGLNPDDDDDVAVIWTLA